MDIKADVEPIGDVEKIQTKTKTEAGEDTYAGALRAVRAGSPAFVPVFVSIFVFV